jgi:RNA polymerase sigma factor (sigma-70 family)
MALVYKLAPNASSMDIELIDVAALKAGDEDAFRTMVDSFQDRVFNTCLGFLQTRQEAEDVAQEVFIEVYRSLGHFRGEAKLSTWVYRIAVTKSLQEIRKRRRKKRLAIFTSNEQAEDSLASAGESDESNHPLAQLENKERAEVLYSALSKLPESQRVAFTLHKIEGLSYQEISDVMDTSIPSVESLIHRARANLRKRLYNFYRTQSE